MVVDIFVAGLAVAGVIGFLGCWSGAGRRHGLPLLRSSVPLPVPCSRSLLRLFPSLPPGCGRAVTSWRCACAWDSTGSQPHLQTSCAFVSWVI